MKVVETEFQTHIKSEHYHNSIILNHPLGTFKLTPASKALLATIEENRKMFSGNGIDWGSGIGCLSIFASKITNTDNIIGLEIIPENLSVSKENAIVNNCSDKVKYFWSNSYEPYDDNENKMLTSIKGDFSFIISNPPSSEGDDGLEFRRMVLKEGRQFLKPGGLVFLNISFQYGEARIQNLINEIHEYSYVGKLYSSELSEFDLKRKDLLKCIENYIHEEEATGIEYTFLCKNDPGKVLSAQGAFDQYMKDRANPFTRWETHLFKAT